MPLNRLLFDSTVELHLDMERVAIESRATIVKLLQQMEQELIAKVADGVTDWSKARINAQLKEADSIINQYYSDIATTSQSTSAGVAQVAASATADSLVAAVGGQVAISAIPTAAYLETLASDTIIQGVTQSGWWSKQSSDASFKFQSAVRQGLVSAETTPQIVRRVRDVMDLSRRNAETLVHTSVQSVANTTREKIFADNDDVMSGKEWSSALDRKTCPTCGALDGKRWTTDGKPIKHSMVYQIPPKHFRCRCSMVPVLKTWAELGINMDELPDGTRASMEGQVNDKTFEDWLKRKTETDHSFADRTLGKGRAELWKSGKITMDQMIQGGKPLTIIQLKEKYGDYKTWSDMGMKSVKDLKLNTDLISKAPKLLEGSKSSAEALTVLRKNLGVLDGERVNVDTPIGKAIIDDNLLAHIVEKRTSARERYAKWILPTLKEPTEVWLSKYGENEERKRFIKLFSDGKQDMLVVVSLLNDNSIWNVIPMPTRSIDNQRNGKLLWKSYQ